MAPPRILHMMTPLKHMSPFDVNMALDAGYDDAITYTNVTIDDVYGLIQDAIFSRSPEGIKRQGAFIGGKRAIEALDMMDRAKKAMVPPFEISVFADPAGSFTTAAAMALLGALNWSVVWWNPEGRWSSPDLVAGFADIFVDGLLNDALKKERT